MIQRFLLLLACVAGGLGLTDLPAQGQPTGRGYEWLETGRHEVGPATIRTAQALWDGVAIDGARRVTWTRGERRLEFRHGPALDPMGPSAVADARYEEVELRDRVQQALAPGFVVAPQHESVYVLDPTTGILHLTHRYLAWRAHPRAEREIAIDANSGSIFRDRSLLRGIDIVGTVEGFAPLDPFPYFGPAGVVPVALPFVSLTPVGQAPTTADAAGGFVIPCPGGPVTVFARLEGPYFSVFNQAGPEAQFIGTLVPGVPQVVTFNATPTDEATAEVSAYHALARSLAFIESLAPGFAPAQVPVDAFVNQPGQCYAFYSPLFAAMYFTPAGAGCPNAAYSTVVAHEYFHHLAFGLGGVYSEPYEEAMADVFAAYAFDTSVVGASFFGLGADLRPLDGNAQFPDPSPDPTVEGLPLAQAFWDLRLNLMADVGPVAGAELAAQLWLSSVLVGDGEVSTSVLTQLLLLDDDDGNLANGTPHGPSILAAFAAHGFTLPLAAITNLGCQLGVGTVELSWDTPMVAYDTITVFRDGVLIAALPGGASQYSDVLPPAGTHFYAVRGETAGVTTVPALCTVAVPAFTTFVRGDANSDGTVNVLDAVRIVGVLFQGVPGTGCQDAMDVNDSGAVDLADVSYLLPHLFLMTQAPPPPYPAPGVDPTPDAILCP
ncbi:MAG: dockerin type I repeat-containing protein [Planctomycetota bacterium]